MPPIVRGRIGGIDIDGFDAVDRLQNALDLRPAVHAQKDFATGTNEGQRRDSFAWRRRAHDVDTRNDGAKIVRRPADECEDAAGREAYDPPLTVDDLVFCDVTEANPMLDLLFDPGQVNMGKRGR